jgi:hypothetical protein
MILGAIIDTFVALAVCCIDEDGRRRISACKLVPCNEIRFLTRGWTSTVPLITIGKALFKR